MDSEITPQDVINAYRCGLFPMADSRDATQFFWYDPPMRGQLSISHLHIPERLRRTVLQYPYEIKINHAFEKTIDGCAEQAPDRADTWINSGIRSLFITLHHHGYAHSIEAYQDGTLVGGLYGLAIGGAFMGESMFSRARDSSKICLVHLCARLYHCGFTILDTQFVNPHLEQFGVHEIPKDEYLEKLKQVIDKKTNFEQLEHSERDLVRHYLTQNK